MRNRFFVIRLISGIYKFVAVLLLIGMVGTVAFVLIDAERFPQIDAKLPVIAFAVAIAIVGPVALWGMAQFLDLLMAIETNTRASTKMLQQLGRVMNERL